MSKVIVDNALLQVAIMALRDNGGEGRAIANRLEDEMVELSDRNYDEMVQKARWYDILESNIDCIWDSETKEYDFYLLNLLGRSVDAPCLRDTLDLIFMAKGDTLN